MEDRMRYEEELKGLRSIIENQKKNIEAIKSEANEEHSKCKETIQQQKIDIESVLKEANSLKIEIGELKKKHKELEDKHEHFVGEMKDKIECPVCLDVPRIGPVPVCPNGHFVCMKCKTESCPTCRVIMGDGKSLLAVTIIENIEYKCKFDDCEDYFTVDKLEDHYKDCYHRIVSCPADSCREQVGLSKLIDHLIEENCSYDSALKRVENNSLVKDKFTMKEAMRSIPTIEWKLTIYTYEDVDFAILLKKQDGLYYFSMVMFSSEDECSKYKVEMTVHDRDSTDVSFNFIGTPCSIDGDKIKLKYLGLAVTSNGIEKVLRAKSNNTFEFSLTFSIKKK
eukprot:GFUD01110021.1.p1 GENE.GFUD01110021.1~~GFUD01110021.1.p1  ORF type:complete len:338 (+),score=71.96 GFUD01110021.1:91-1104(+)